MRREPRSTHGTHVRIAALLVVLLVAVGCASGSKSTTASTSSTSKPVSTTSTAVVSTTTTTVKADTAVWPFAGSSTRYRDPVAAADGFAVTYLGFVNPVVGGFMQGDSRSGEVAIQPTNAGPVTTVVVRKLGADDTWWVLGAATPNLQLQSPTALASISSPVTLAGQSTAFEANVTVEIRQDGALTPLATDFVMGGANGEMGPFSKSISFSRPTAPGGVIILKTLSSENGNISEASVLQVQFS